MCVYVLQYFKGCTKFNCFCTNRFDVIIDCVGGDTEQWAMDLLKPWSGAKYVTLVTPLLLNTDSMGLMDGTLKAVFTLQSKVIQVNMGVNSSQTLLT